MACCTVLSWSFWACRLALTSSTTLAGACTHQRQAMSSATSKQSEIFSGT